METKYKITVPKPCHENWNGMSPDATGRFCRSCTKSVVDFTSKNATEIQEYFIANPGNTCGRFKHGQLDAVIIKIPKQLVFTQVHFHKMFLLALFISMGTTLFSCQDDNGDVKKIDSVEFEDPHERATMGVVMHYTEPKTSSDDSLQTETVLNESNQKATQTSEEPSKDDIDPEFIIDSTKTDTE